MNGVSPEMTAKLVSAFQALHDESTPAVPMPVAAPVARDPIDDLSPRELEVAMLLVQGLRQEDIAKRLSLSAKTVNTHKTRLFQKLAVQDNIALARLCAQYGLLDPARSI